MSDTRTLIDSIAYIDSEISFLNEQLQTLRQQRQEVETQLIEQVTAFGESVSWGGYKVRWNAGRTSTAWDAFKLDAVLPPELKAAVMMYLPKPDTKVLAALEKSGKLPEAALEAKTVSEPKGRWVLEKESL